MTYEEWKPIAAELLAAYPHLAIPPETLVKYASSLSDLPAHCVQVGSRAAVKRCTFFPTIADIREYAEAEASRFKAESQIDTTHQLVEENTIPLEERRELMQKWGPRIREVIDNSTGPLAPDLRTVGEPE